jgi:ureidoglycolate lyase
MESNTIKIRPLTAADFAPYGDVLDCSGAPDKIINQGLCDRYHDRAKLDVEDARAGISMFNAQIRSLPLTLDMMERHPHGSQAFLPLTENPFLVIVAPDDDGKPGHPIAFLTASHQGVNYHKNTWHGVLTPLHEPGVFAVVDRIGNTPNLQEHWFERQYIVYNEAGNAK